MRKKKSNTESCLEDKIEKIITKRINNNMKNKRINSENLTNKHINLFLENRKKIKLNNNNVKQLNTLNTNEYYPYYNKGNIFLENNDFLFPIKKTRNRILFIHKNNSKPIQTFEIKFNNKDTSINDINDKKSKNSQSLYETLNENSSNINSMNDSYINNHSFNEETGRKFYLNNKENINKFHSNHKKIYTKNMYNQRLYENTGSTKINSNNMIKKNISENNSYFSNNNKIQNFNFGNLSTIEFTPFDNTNNYNNSIISTNNNGSFILNFIKKENKYPFGLTYKRVNLSFKNYNKKKKCFNKNNSFNNNSEQNVINENFKKKTKQKTLSNLYNKDKIILYYKKEIKKHYSSKSQESINQNNKKFIHLLTRNNHKFTKKVKNNYTNYKNNIYYIIKIQKWWKYMLFHLYIEQKIIYIQKKYKKYLIDKKKKNKLFYMKKINEILLIQKKWKKYFQLKKCEINKKKNLNIINDDNYIPKLIPFEYDNLDINNYIDSNFDTKSNIIISNNMISNQKRQSKVYYKKVSYSRNKNNKLTKLNTVSNFYLKKNKFFKEKNNFKIEKNVNFCINSLKKETFIDSNKLKNSLELRIKNVKINNNLNEIKIKNNYNSFFVHRPIIDKIFIEKEYKNKCYNIFKYKKLYINNNYFYLSKKRINKFFILKKIILIQKYFKIYLKTKNRQFIKKPISINYYITKFKKLTNLLNNSYYNPIEIFSFNGSNFIDNSNKDKLNEKEIFELKENLFSYNNKQNNLNLFSFNDNNQIINNNNNEINCFNKNEKLNYLFNKFFHFFISKLKKFIFLFKFINIIKRIINKKQNIFFNLLKSFVLIDNKNKINYRKYIRKNTSTNSLIENNKRIKDLVLDKFYKNEEKEEGLSNYILNYFYKYKKFTNINIKLIKERLKKYPLEYKSQNNIIKYINNLHMDIINNKICYKCYCKIGENYEDGCLCHLNNDIQKITNKGGLSLYRQKINKIINNRKKLINDDKNNIQSDNNNDESKDNNNIYNFTILNNTKKTNLIGEYNHNNKNNSKINRYETESGSK